MFLPTPTPFKVERFLHLNIILSFSAYPLDNFNLIQNKIYIPNKGDVPLSSPHTKSKITYIIMLSHNIKSHKRIITLYTGKIKSYPMPCIIKGSVFPLF